MSVTRLSPLCFVLVFASSALGTYPFAYPDLRAPVSYSPHLIYGSGIVGGNADLSGFSYFTKDFVGGESDVVFFTGPNSDVKMNDEVASVKDKMSSLPSAAAETKTDSDDAAPKSDSTENQDSAKMAPMVPVEIKEPSTPAKGEEPTLKTTVFKEDKKDADSFQGIPNGQFVPENGAGFDVPWPIHRLGGGSGSFYSQLPSSFSGFSGYEPSDYFRSQYVPLYSRYNSYQHLYNPLYPSLDTDYYNPGIFPSVYQSPIIAPSSLTNYISEKPQNDLETKLRIDKRLGNAEEPTAASTTEKSDQKTGGDDSTSEKGTELPTTTEQLVEKSTTVSEPAPTTADDIKETTTVVTDAVAVP